MRITMAVLYRDCLYHHTFSEGTEVKVADTPDAGLRIQDLGIPFEISCSGTKITIKKANTPNQIEAQMNHFVVIDNDDKLAVFCTEATDSGKNVLLPQECEVCIGRSSKPNPNGCDNQVVLDLPFVSGFHCKVIRSNGKTMIYDVGSRNGIYVNGRRVENAHLTNGDVVSLFTVKMTYQNDHLYFENVRNCLTLRPIRNLAVRKDAPKKPCLPKDFCYSRSPRLTTSIRPEVINLEKPPQQHGEVQINWINVLLMPAISIALMMVLVFAMGMNATMLIMSGVMSAVSAIVAIVTYRRQKQKYAQKDALIDHKYHDYLKAVKQKLEAAKMQQLSVLRTSNPVPQECISIVQGRRRQLWERGPADEDFLSVRIGTGTVSAAVTAKYQQSQVVINETALEEEAKLLAQSSVAIHNAPIVCNLAEHKLVGVTGNRADEIQIVRNMVVELATAHSYDEVKVIALVSEDEQSEWDWIRWLPHCCDGQKMNRFVFTNADEAETALDQIAEILGKRATEQKDNQYLEHQVSLPYYVFVVATPLIVEKHPIRKYLLGKELLGCSTLFLYDKLRYLPKECDTIIDICEGRGELYSRMDSTRRIPFAIDLFCAENADKFARAMAPLYISAEGNAAALPQSVSFLDGYGVQHPEQLNIAKRWHEAKTYKSLSVPIAKKTDGEAFCFDVHRSCHGTHGVVAGMTGSGKTEMVQSWLLSLAVNFSPQDVSFVLIDFKGTSLVAPFLKLPHLAGSISNLDTRSDIARNLIALRSEIHRREQLIDQYKDKSVKNINDLNKAYDKGNVPEKMPILLVVIDEYAEFKKQYPEFGNTIDSLTQKGQALGMFITLMAQKPAGVVSAQSEDNIRYRWCLRVANYSASREMLGRPDAAKITLPGRAFVKVGEDDVYEQVQSFWSGAPYSRGQQEHKTAKALISSVALNGKRMLYENNDSTATLQSDETQIDAVVRYITDYCKTATVPDTIKIWTEKLPERIALTDLLKEGFDGTQWPATSACAPVIGLLDDPSMQKQYPLVLDFAKTGHTIVYGAPTTGKTTLLQTLVTSIAMSRKPDEVSIYAMDFGGWNLNVLKRFPHIGGIANDNEPDRIKKLVALLQDILEQRKTLFSKAGVGNILAYRDATGERLPDVILVIDNFGPVLKMYPDLDTFFASLCGSGANYGVYMVATASAANAVPTKISQNIKHCLALQMIDKSDYTYLVGKAEEKLPPILGRGLAKGAPPLEFQTALPAPGQNDRAISDQIRGIAEAMHRSWAGDCPAKIPELPEVIPYGSVQTQGICLGLTCEKVTPVDFRLDKQHFLLISAMSSGDRSGALHLLSRQVKEKVGGTLCIFDTNKSEQKLQTLANSYLSDVAEIDSFVEAMRPELQRRYAQKQNNPTALFEPITLVVCDYAQFFQRVSNDTIARLNAIVKIGAGLGLFLFVADEAFALASMVNKGESVALAMAKATYTLLLGGCLNDHGAIQTKAAYAQKSEAVKATEGYYVHEGQPVRFKMMRATEEVTV